MDLDRAFGLESVPKEYFQSLAEVLEIIRRGKTRNVSSTLVMKLSLQTNKLSEHLDATKDILCEIDQEFTVGIAQERRMVKAGQPRVIQIPQRKINKYVTIL